MELYLVSEINAETNMVLQTWVCLSEKIAKECLDFQFNVATHYNKEEGLKEPVDTRYLKFFFWQLKDMKIKFEISTTKTF